MTYDELKAELDKLTPEQLQQTALWSGDERGGTIDSIYVLDKDHVNVDGDGLEPLSTYKDDPEFDIASVVHRAPKGTVYLCTDWVADASPRAS